jgi:hypothetical protein
MGNFCICADSEAANEILLNAANDDPGLAAPG